MDVESEIAREIIRRHARQDLRLPDRMVFDHPKLRYLTPEQAEEWLKIGTSSNIHTRSNESLIIESQLDSIRYAIETDVVVVDFGCGDGTKAAHMIQFLKASGHRVARYFPVDVSPTLIDSAIRRVSEWADLDTEQCISICSSFEDVLQHVPPWRTDLGNAATVFGLFLGNTYNNYDSNAGDKILEGLVTMCDCLLLGVKVRRDSSDQEITRIVRQYQSYGDAFTFSFGRTLGVDEGSMTRMVEYNSTLRRVEISIQLTGPVGVGDLIRDGVRNLLVCCSHKPTIDEIITRLAPFFLLEWWSLENCDDVVFKVRVNRGAQQPNEYDNDLVATGI